MVLHFKRNTPKRSYGHAELSWVDRKGVLKAGSFSPVSKALIYSELAEGYFCKVSVGVFLLHVSDHLDLVQLSPDVRPHVLLLIYFGSNH